MQGLQNRRGGKQGRPHPILADQFNPISIRVGVDHAHLITAHTHPPLDLQTFLRPWDVSATYSTYTQLTIKYNI